MLGLIEDLMKSLYFEFIINKTTAVHFTLYLFILLFGWIVQFSCNEIIHFNDILFEKYKYQVNTRN